MIKGPLHRSITSFIAPSLRRHHFSSTTFEMASASTQNAPTADENSALIKALVSLSAKNSKLVRSTTYDVPSAGMKITSWKMNEFKYYDIPSPFPTLARGLFTRKVDDEYAIVVRGYDKFFNIGEVPWTTVRHLPLAFRSLTSRSESLVAIYKSRNQGSLYPFAEVERMHHLHRRSDALPTTCHLKTFPWTRYRRCAQPCTSGRGMAGKASGEGGKDKRRAGRRVV